VFHLPPLDESNQKQAGLSTGQPLHAVCPAVITYYSRAETTTINHFEGEYCYVNKRLPVVKVAFHTPRHTTLYVETSTGRLSTCVEDIDRYEGLSFAFLHKYHAVGSLGKNLRDAITMLAAAGVLAVSLLGLQLFIKGR